MNELTAALKRILRPDSEGGLLGWCTLEKGTWIAERIIEERMTVCVEIGVFGGRSLIAMGLALKYAGHGGFSLGIDPFASSRQMEGITDPRHKDWEKRVDWEEVHQDALRAIRENGAESHCGILRAASEEVCNLVGTIDLLHVDGCHSVLASCRDVETWVPKVRPGGIVILDDSDWETLQPARRMMAALCGKLVKEARGWEAYRR